MSEIRINLRGVGKEKAVAELRKLADRIESTKVWGNAMVGYVVPIRDDDGVLIGSWNHVSLNEEERTQTRLLLNGQMPTIRNEEEVWVTQQFYPPEDVQVGETDET